VRFTHSGLPNTSSLRRLCNIFTRPSHQHSYCGVVRPLLLSSNQHGDFLKEYAARTLVKEYNSKKTSPAVLKFAPRRCRRIPSWAPKHCLEFQEIRHYNRPWLHFLLAKVRNLVRTFVEECRWITVGDSNSTSVDYS
jgi:hypothetical protein